MARVVVPSIAHVADKWSRRANQATPDYETGVSNPRRDWAQNAAAAEPAYKSGVQAAASAGRFGKGVTRVGTPKWQRNAKAKGAPRYGPGVAAAQPDYSGRFGPFLDAVGALDLPARGPRGAPENYGRVQPIGKALHELKTRG